LKSIERYSTALLHDRHADRATGPRMEKSPPQQALLKSASDGTRTRDLRRDRPAL
jgi:hypothetical protein